MKELGKQVVITQLVSEYPLERAGADHVEHQHGVIFITGAGMYCARRDDQHTAL